MIGPGSSFSPASLTAGPASASGTSGATAGSASATTGSTSAGAGAGNPATVTGTPGQTLTLQGDGLTSSGQQGPRSKIMVTLKGPRGPFSGFQVATGKELIGYAMHIVNVGAVKYSDPLPAGTLTLVGGGTGKATSLIAVGGSNPCENPSLNLTQGQSKDFCLAFEVPTGQAAGAPVRDRLGLRRHRYVAPRRLAEAVLRRT